MSVYATDSTTMNCSRAKIVEPVATKDTVLESASESVKSTTNWLVVLLLPAHTFVNCSPFTIQSPSLGSALAANTYKLAPMISSLVFTSNTELLETSLPKKL